MKSYLVIDTSSKYLTVLAANKGAETVVFVPDCALQHSVQLMDAIEKALGQAGLCLADCDFFGAVTGPGSFTGIRIGISTAKGFCTGTGSLGMGVTSFEVLAYNTTKACLAVIDAGRGNYYVCGFDENKKTNIAPCCITLEQLLPLTEGRIILSADRLPFAYESADVTVGLSRAVQAKMNANAMGDLSAFYLKKSQAEEEKK